MRNRTSSYETIKVWYWAGGIKNFCQVFSSDVENPRHVIDRAESNNTGYRSAKLNQRLWPGGVVPYRLDPNFGKSSEEIQNYLFFHNLFILNLRQWLQETFLFKF